MMELKLKIQINNHRIVEVHETSTIEAYQIQWIVETSSLKA